MNILSDSKLKSLRTWLLDREAELLTQIDSAKEALMTAASADGAEVTDLKDQTARSERTSLEDAGAQRDRDKLAHVRAALARVDDGSYGACIDCAQPIDVLRLVAMPTAARCTSCQTQSEARAAPHARTRPS